MQTKIFAHRGASKLAPENTMAAFNIAYQQGADGIETDVHLTKDNIPVLMHDERINRTTNGSGYIKDFTFEQLKQLDTGAWFSRKFTGSEIVSLDRFLEWAQDKSLHLNIELKNNKIDYKHLERIVYNRITHYRLSRRTTLSTFHPKSIVRMKEFNQHIGVGLLMSRRYRHLVSYAKDLGATAVHIKRRSLNGLLVDQCHQENLQVRVFTVNKPAQMLRCFSMGCDGIFTDIPKAAIHYRDQFTKYSATSFRRN